MSDDRPMTTPALQAKVALRMAWFEAHPNQPVPEARAEVEALFTAIEFGVAPAPVPHPGRHHEFHALCRLCGEPGHIHLSVIGGDEYVAVERRSEVADG